MIKVLQQRSRKDAAKTDSSSLRPARSVPSIAAATGTHSRQTSLTSSQLAEEKKEEKTWKGSIGEPHASPPSGKDLKSKSCPHIEWLAHLVERDSSYFCGLLALPLMGHRNVIGSFQASVYSPVKWGGSSIILGLWKLNELCGSKGCATGVALSPGLTHNIINYHYC